MTFSSSVSVFASAACILCATSRAHALELELSAQTLATLVSDDAAKGGGVGLGIEGGIVVVRGLALPSSEIVTRARVSVLAGAGLAWGLEAGAAWRAEIAKHWQPEIGAYLLYLCGDLARAIDEHGQLAKDPVAALVGLTPLRLPLDQGWVSFLSLRVGATLGTGHPPLAASLTFFEVGRTF
jgi:hypothetical protein